MKYRNASEAVFFELFRRRAMRDLAKIGAALFVVSVILGGVFVVKLMIQ